MSVSTRSSLVESFRSAYVHGMGARRPSPNMLLGYLADNGYELEAECSHCKRKKRLSAIAMARQYGAQYPYPALGYRMRCQCGEKMVSIRRVKWSDYSADQTEQGEVY